MYKTQSEKQTIPKSEKYEIQERIEKILRKHKIEPKAFAYYIMLFRQGMDDLLIRKKGDIIEIGYNNYSLSADGEMLPDIVASFVYDNGLWIPTTIENSDFENTHEDEEGLEYMLNFLDIQIGCIKESLKIVGN